MSLALLMWKIENQLARPLALGVVAAALSCLAAVSSSATGLLAGIYSLAGAPALLVLAFAFALRRRSRPMAIGSAAYAAVTVLLLRHGVLLRGSAKWALTRQKTAETLDRQPAGNHGRKHLVWDQSGSALGGHNVTYLVYDPADGLQSAGATGVGYIDQELCSVYQIARLEPRYYLVRFYSEEAWARCKQKTP